MSYGIITVGNGFWEELFMPTPKNPPLAADRYALRYAQLRQQLQELAYFCKGTVLQRSMKCGHPSCACHQDPSKRHGPYWEWTYKVQGKTVNVKLPSEAGPLYQAATRQYRKLKSLLTRLERISRTALAAQARQSKARRAS
jgi:hypothetical protein